MGNIQRPTETVDCKNFTGGDWQEQSGQNIDVYSPLYGDKVGSFRSSTIADVDNIIARASEALSILERHSTQRENTNYVPL